MCCLRRQVRERHNKLDEFAAWLAVLKGVQAQELQRQHQEETALALWDMFLAYGGKAGLDQQEKFDEMKENSAAFQKVLRGPVQALGCACQLHDACHCRPWLPLTAVLKHGQEHCIAMSRHSVACAVCSSFLCYGEEHMSSSSSAKVQCKLKFAPELHCKATCPPHGSASV